MPDLDEIKIGDQLAKEYGGREEFSKDDPTTRVVQAYINRVGAHVAMGAQRKLPYRFHYVPSPDFISAFALPGGHVYIGGGLMALMDSEDELASVLGHEVEHIDHYHCAERLQTQAALQKIPLAELFAIPVEVFEQGYSKTQELEADREGTRLAVKVHYSPLGAVRMFQAFDRLYGETTRRAQSPEAGVLAGRAAYVGGCLGTSNVLTGFRYGVPVYGTAAHSWVLAFPDELEAQRALQKLLGAGTIYLIDTYDTLEGARKAASLGRPLWGVRLDSGDLGALAREVRRILDGAGLADAKIMASGDLNEYKLAALVAEGAPIDAFGVGTELATSADAPALSAIYKMVEIEEAGATRYTAKFSEDKPTLPGAKQIYRCADCDVVALAGERMEGEPLLSPVMAGGRLAGSLPDAAAARAHTAQSLAGLGKPHRVEYSRELRALLEWVRSTVEATHA